MSPNKPNPEIFTIQEVAERWRVSVPTVRRWVLIGELPANRHGRQYRIPASVIAERERLSGPKDAA